MSGLFPENETIPTIKSISYSQDSILQSIIYLFIPDGHIQMDPCYNKGGFYRSGKIKVPDFRFDIKPISGTRAKQGDCRNLPIKNNSVNSIIYDPPFLTTNPKSKTKTGNIMHQRFSSFENVEELQKFYLDSLYEFDRILVGGGVLIWKCQDTVRSCKQYWNHIYVYEIAMKLSFTIEDLFILLAKNRPISGKIKRQQHARKFHSYFWVLRKQGGK